MTKNEPQSNRQEANDYLMNKALDVALKEPLMDDEGTPIIAHKSIMRAEELRKLRRDQTESLHKVLKAKVDTIIESLNQRLRKEPLSETFYVMDTSFRNVEVVKPESVEKVIMVALKQRGYSFYIETNSPRGATSHRIMCRLP